MTTEKRQRNGVPGAVQRPRAENEFMPAAPSHARTRFVTVDQVIFEVLNASVLPSVYLTKAIHAARKSLPPAPPLPAPAPDDPEEPLPAPTVALRDNPHALPEQVPADVLELVLKYCYFHTSKKRAKMKAQDSRNWDDEYVRALNPRRLCELASASYYLEIPHLVEHTCRAIANIISGKDPDQIRDTFQIENDFLQRLLPHGHPGPSGRRAPASGRAGQRRNGSHAQPSPSNPRKSSSYSLSEIDGFENQDSDENVQGNHMSQLSLAEAVQWIESTDTAKKGPKKRKKKRNKNKHSPEPNHVQPRDQNDVDMTSPRSQSPTPSVPEQYEPLPRENGRPDNHANSRCPAIVNTGHPRPAAAKESPEIVNLISDEEVIDISADLMREADATGAGGNGLETLQPLAPERVPIKQEKPSTETGTELQSSPGEGERADAKGRARRRKSITESSDESEGPDVQTLSPGTPYSSQNEPHSPPFLHVQVAAQHPTNVDKPCLDEERAITSRNPTIGAATASAGDSERNPPTPGTKDMETTHSAGERSDPCLTSKDAALDRRLESSPRKNARYDAAAIKRDRRLRESRTEHGQNPDGARKTPAATIATAGAMHGQVLDAASKAVVARAFAKYSNVLDHSHPHGSDSSARGGQRSSGLKSEENIHGAVNGQKQTKPAATNREAPVENSGVVRHENQGANGAQGKEGGRLSGPAKNADLGNRAFISCPEQMNREVEDFEKRLTGDCVASADQQGPGNHFNAEGEGCCVGDEVRGEGTTGESSGTGANFWQRKVEEARLSEREVHLKQFSKSIGQQMTEANGQRADIRDALAQVRLELSQISDPRKTLEEKVKHARLSERETNLMKFASSVQKQINSLNGQKEEVLDRLALAQMQLSMLRSE